MEQLKQAEDLGAIFARNISLGAAAQVGDATSSIDTPSLVLDLDAFEDNLRTMQALAERHCVALRPHAKAHRCPEIALRQVALGAVGICCQKVSEAVPFVAAGLQDIHISNEVVGESKLALLASLAHHAQFSVCVDNLSGLEALSAALREHGSTVAVLVEIDAGQGRCGVQTPDEALALARRIIELPNVSFRGLQAYHGGLQHKRSLARREKACKKLNRLVRRYLDALKQAGIDCPVVTGGGTGTAVFDVAGGVFTEIQPGTYAFMDTDYCSIDWGEALAFHSSLFLLATVMSTPAAGRVVLDFGLKSTSAESGTPALFGHEGLRCIDVHDEHCIIEVSSSANPPTLGQKLRLVPSHCDPTFNLHDTLVAVRGDRVEALWPIAARGLSR